MAKLGVIYKITNPSGKIYIGKTIRFNDRMSSYRNNNSKEQPLIYRSIKKYGWEKHTVEIIEENQAELLNNLEIEYIKKYNSFHYDNPNGMNLTRGGEGVLGIKQSKTTIKKRINKIKGRKHSESTKKLMSDLKKGKVPPCTKLPKSKHFLECIKKSNSGRIVSKEEVNQRKQTRLNNFIKKYGSILQIDVLTNNIIKEWIMLPKDISKVLNIDDTSIIKCLNKKSNSGSGYKWAYKNIKK